MCTAARAQIPRASGPKVALLWAHTEVVHVPDDTHERLKELARHRGVSVNKLMEELSTIAIAQHDAETRFRALAARGSVKEGLRVLDKLDDALGRVDSR